MIDALIAQIFTTGHFPSEFNIAKVIPIHKKNKDKAQICNYRPMSLLSHLSKLVEKIIKNRLIRFSDEKNIIVVEQFEFRSGDSTTDQLV